jgi:hypothetical protein
MFGPSLASARPHPRGPPSLQRAVRGFEDSMYLPGSQGRAMKRWRLLSAIVRATGVRRFAKVPIRLE